MTSVEEMKPERSINDIISKNDSEATVKAIQATIIAIAAKYLSMNPKGKAITNDAGFLMIAEFIISECKNLEFQELEYIFKKGVMGRFGEIYNDISIDTICGVNGWIENYYKTDRRRRIDSVKLESEIHFTGSEISEAEFLEKYPEYAIRKRLRELREIAVSKKMTVSELKEFYKIKGYKVTDMQDDIEALRKQYEKSDEKDYISWDKYLLNWMNTFVFANVYKNKE